ncbi:MAG: rhomboid family intramembrane serine protease [Candidatus Cyclobacteriaceae bacterium M3_2C_046]
MSEETQEEAIRPSPRKARVVNTLILLNIVMFAITYLASYQWDLDLYRILGLHHPDSEYFAWYQFITHIFMHGSFFHIFINMFVLWMFGTVLEKVWRGKRFVFFYFFTGLGAAVLHLAVATYNLSDLKTAVNQYIENPGYERFVSFKEEYIDAIPPAYANRADSLQNYWGENNNDQQFQQQSVQLVENYLSQRVNQPTVGASGAIFGLLLAFGVLFPNVMIYLYFLFPVKAKYFVMIIGAFELYRGIFGENVSIANFAHLGGMIFGFILLKIWGMNAKNVKSYLKHP